MPPVQKKGSFVGKLGNKLFQAHEQHKGDETEYSQFGNLPGGINNGVAQLIECSIEQIEKADSKNRGEYYFRAVGTVILPREHDGVPIFGLRTTIMENIFDTPESASDRKTVDQHWAWILNELRKLGMDTADMDVSSDEALQASLDGLVQAGPYFRFRTWLPPKSKDPQFANREPRVMQFWDGMLEGFVPQEVESVVDNTEHSLQDRSTTAQATAKPVSKPPVANKPTTVAKPPSGPVNPQTTAKPTSKPQPTTTVPKASQTQAKPTQPPTTKPAPGKPVQGKPTPKTPTPDKGLTADDMDPPNPSSTHEISEDATLEELAELAHENEVAQERLRELAKEVGLSDQDVDNAPNWESLVGLIESLRANIEAETSEENQEESSEEEFIPGVDQVWAYKPIDGKTNRPVAKPVDCKITEVDTKSKTVTLENLADSRKKYLKVPFDQLIGDEG